MALRILHLTPYYEEAWAYGGIPRLAASLCHALARRGHRVTVCTTDACHRAARLAGPPGATRLADEPSWRARARQSQETIHRRYDADVVAPALEQVYAGALGAR